MKLRKWFLRNVEEGAEVGSAATGEAAVAPAEGSTEPSVNWDELDRAITSDEAGEVEGVS